MSIGDKKQGRKERIGTDKEWIKKMNRERNRIKKDREKEKRKTEIGRTGLKKGKKIIDIKKGKKEKKN